MHRRTVSPATGVVLAALASASLAAAAQAAGERAPRQVPAPRPADPAATVSMPAAPGFADSVANLLRAVPVTLVPPPPPAEEPEPPEIRRKTLAYDLVRVGQDVSIGEDEVVYGDIIVLGGDLVAEGAIEGSAVVVGGTIELGSRSRVAGEVVALGGRVERETGAAVAGGVVGLSLLPQPLPSGVDWRRARDLGKLASDAIGATLVLAWTVLVTLLVRKPISRARSWLDAAPFRTTGLGVVGMTGGLFAVTMGIVLLAITLVGLPVALLVAVFTVVLLGLAEAVGLVHFGSWICSLLRLRVRSTLAMGAIGVLVVAAPQIAADISRLSGRGSTPLQVAHVLLIAGTLAAGLGALVLSRLGRHAAPPAEPAAPRAFAPPAGREPLAGARS